MKQLLAVVWLALIALAAPVAAQTFPQLTGRVVDQAHLLTAAQVADITSKSQALEAQSGRQFVVATVNSLEGHEIEDYAYRLGRYWKIGSTKENDGVLLLVAPREHKVWIATGYGAGGFLTDAMAGVITREAILPRFKAGDMGGGIQAGADAIIKQMSLPPEQAQTNVAAAEQAQKQRQHSGGNPLPVIFWFLVIGFVILSHFRRGAGRRYRTRGGGISPWVVLWGLNALSNSGRRSGWGGGSSWGGGGSSWGGGGGGGFGGFSGGGGSFGGGGAGGSW
ncbi:MAG: TPM domain-containing protein [Sphingomicrobium sp.]